MAQGVSYKEIPLNSWDYLRLFLMLYLETEKVKVPLLLRMTVVMSKSAQAPFSMKKKTIQRVNIQLCFQKRPSIITLVDGSTKRVTMATRAISSDCFKTKPREIWAFVL